VVAPANRGRPDPPVSRVAIYKTVAKALEKVVREPVEAMLEIELQRLDALTKVLF
jgi:hypothetical protein